MSVPRNQAMGRGGFCICIKCGYRAPHQRGIPCQEQRCPNCGAKLMREGGYHHQLWLEKQAKKAQQNKD